MKKREIIYRWLKRGMILEEFPLESMGEVIAQAEITLIGWLTEQNLDEIGQLVRALRGRGSQPRMSLDAIAAQRHAHVLLSFDDTEGHKVVGTGTLFIFEQVTGCKASIEDVVVNGTYRGHGIGETIVRKLVERARLLNATSVSLTSKPERKEANALYAKLGFERRETNVYRLRFPVIGRIP